MTVMTFPAIVKSKNLLSPEKLVKEIREGNLIEAILPNWVLRLSEEWNFLLFDWETTSGEHDKRALIICSKNDEELVKRVRNLIPVETIEEREDRIRTEYDMENYYENQIRAAGLEEILDDIPDSVYYDEDAAFNQFYFD